MDIVIRRAVSTDSLFLTSISVVAKRYCDCIEEYVEEGEASIITKDYIESNIVFVAEKEHTIIAYCSLHEVKRGCSENQGMITAGYWLNHMFIRPAYIHSEIGKRLIEKIITYCRENDIRKFNVLSCLSAKDFYSEMGATYIKNLPKAALGKESCLFKFIIFDKQQKVVSIDKAKKIDVGKEIGEKMIEDEKTNKNILQKKLFELDRDAEEDEPYDDDLYEEDELYDDDTYEEDGLYGQDIYEADTPYDEAIEEEDKLYEENEFCDDEVEAEDKSYGENETYDDEGYKEDKPYRKSELYDDEGEEDIESVDEVEEPNKDDEGKIDLKENRTQDKEQFVCRLSYDDFLNATVPIGYKFECEEELEKKKSQNELQSKEIEYRKVVEELEEKVEQVEEEAVAYSIEEDEDDARTEKEKMLEGSMYIAWGEEIVNDRRRARRLLREFNHTDPEDRKMTYSILKKLFGKIGEYIHIEPEFKCSYGYNIYVGNDCYIGYNCVIVDHASVTIGDNCIISGQVGIYTLAYPLNAKMRAAGYEYAKPVTIGNNVWIGGGAIINPGVSIGDNVVISPGSVIVSDIPDNALVKGNPAKIINYITE